MRFNRELTDPPPGHSFRFLRWRGRVSEAELLLEGGKKRKIGGEGDRWHFHSAMELTLFSEGQGTRFVGDHIGAFGPQDLVLLGAGLPHYWHVRGFSRGVSLQWDFPEGHPFWNFPELCVLRPLFERAARGLRIHGRSGERIAGALSAIEHADGPERLAAFLSLFGLLERGLTSGSEVSELSRNAFHIRDAAGRQQALGEAMRYLLAHFRTEVRLEKLLEITGMSKSTFSRQFQRHSGKTFQEFVLSLRMQAVCRALLESDASVAFIAQDCGFSEVSFFNRAFRRIQGCTPSEYRRVFGRKSGA